LRWQCFLVEVIYGTAESFDRIPHGCSSGSGDYLFL